MAKLVWDALGQRLFEVGLDKGVLYLSKQDGGYEAGQAWNGLSKVSEAPEGGEATTIYANNGAYGQVRTGVKFKGTIEAYTYPEAFSLCNGDAQLVPGFKATGQARKSFGFTYRTLIANDTASTDYGYTLHLVYGASTSPSSKDNATIGENVEAATQSWSFETTPVSLPDFPDVKPTAHFIFETKAGSNNALIKEIEDLLYGTDGKDAVMPSPTELSAIIKKHAGGSGTPAGYKQD